MSRALPLQFHARAADIGGVEPDRIEDVTALLVGAPWLVPAVAVLVVLAAGRLTCSVAPLTSRDKAGRRGTREHPTACRA